MPADLPILTRIDRVLVNLGERRDVDTVRAARGTFGIVMSLLRGFEKAAASIKKQHKTAEDRRRAADTHLIPHAYIGKTVGSTPVWILLPKSSAESPYGLTQEVPAHIKTQRLEVWLEMPTPANKRYGGVYIDYTQAHLTGNRDPGGAVHVVLRDDKPYTEEDFTNPFWFMQNAARLMEQRDSVFVHELTHHWDTMRTPTPKGYKKVVDKSAGAFWRTPEDQPPPAEYILSDNELNARFNEFVSACLRQIDISAVNAQNDFRTLDDAAKEAGKSFEEYTGGSRPKDFVDALVFRTIFGSSAHSFLNRVGHVVSSTEFPQIFNKMELSLKKRYIRRIAALYVDLEKYANGLTAKILKRKTLGVSMKRAKLPSGGYGYIHKT